MSKLLDHESLVMSGALDSLSHLELQLRDVDYFDENAMVHYEVMDSNMLAHDAGMLDTMRYYHDYTMFTLYNLLAGPINIVLDHAFLIWIALLTRFMHLVIDLCPFPKKNTLKNIITCLLGVYLLEQYLRRIGIDSLNSIRTLIYATLFTFALLVSFDRRDRGKMTDGRKRDEHPNPNIAGYSLIVFAPILINEYNIHVEQRQQHNYLRGILMTLAMKVVSQLYSAKPKSDKSDGFISQLTYLLHPASCISGLWHVKLETAGEVVSAASQLTKFATQIYRFSMTLCRTFLVLVISTNIPELIYLVDSATSSSKLKLMSEVYLIAQEFRFSHYFSCLLFKSLFSIWEEPNLKDEDKLKPCEIGKVEWPRSLLQVVTSWNIPMHVWLKDYVFKPARYKTNTAAAIFFTYLVSSLLHGFKCHLWMVLLTLGFLTWVEYNLRLKLSKRFDACILAQPCRYTLDKRCTRGHQNTVHNSFITRSFNLGFRLLAMAHLAYLGYIFLGNTDQANFRDVIRLWSELSFFGHFLAIGTYFTSLVI